MNRKQRLFAPRLEKDFEFFVRALPALDPVEFLGLARLMGVKMYEWDGEIPQNPQEIRDRAFDVVLEEMMDRYLGLTKKRRREINEILREVKKGGERNGTSTEHCAKA